MAIGFAPTTHPSRPIGGTPPINPDRDEINRSKDMLADSIKEKAPLIAALLKTPVGCDIPEQGGITGNIGKRGPKPPYVCYLA